MKLFVFGVITGFTFGILVIGFLWVKTLKKVSNQKK
jgi:hypothetical protein